jgi:UDP-glucuronate decarboxylase
MVIYQNQIVGEDLRALYNSNLDWQSLKNKTILVTGATGMLAAYFSFMLLYLNQRQNLGIRLILLARNKNKLETIFGNETETIKFLVQDVCNEIRIKTDINYIFHAAGAASPHYIINDPVSIITANTVGTLNVLDLAKKTSVQKVIFTSTREVYGKVENKNLIAESDMGSIDTMDSRSCYPESKRMAETLLKSYSLQHSVNFNTLRIAHTYGPGMQIHNDGRVMADFINDAINNRDIRLNSAGLDERAFCYITDAVEAIFRVLIYGKKDEAYNIANEQEPIKIIELARLIQEISGNNNNVEVAVGQPTAKGYCNYKRVKLDTAKIEGLGWKPKISLKSGLLKTITSFKD